MPGDGALVVNHIPFLIDHARGEFGTIIGHVARPNAVWKQCSRGVRPAVVILPGRGELHLALLVSDETGDWQGGADLELRSRPRAWGPTRVRGPRSAAGARDGAHARRRIVPRRAVARVRCARRLHRRDAEGIVGIEIPIATLTGKWKVSQNRPEADRRAVVAALRQREDGRSQAMAALVQEAIDRGRSE